jgi:cytochrome P450
MSLLTHSWAVLYETLRMFPPVPDIPKYVAEDTSLTIGNASGEQRAVPLPRGTVISVDVPGLHYNSRYWKDPEEFRPARFLDPNWPRDAFIPFSAGARGCIGRKFAETAIIAILTMIVSRYKLEIKEESQFSNETFEQRKARVLASKGGFTLTTTPKRVPLVLRRR